MLLYHLFFYGMVVICLVLAFKSVKYFIKAMRGQKLATIILSAFTGILAAYVAKIVVFLIAAFPVGYLLVAGAWSPFYQYSNRT